MQILDETPGIIAQYPGGTANPSAPASVSYPVIRGALPYETESLIDGHPLANQSYGDFVITYLNPWLLQGIEVVKGPGASSTQDNNAINGTVNFRTLEPTAKRQSRSCSVSTATAAIIRTSAQPERSSTGSSVMRSTTRSPARRDRCRMRRPSTPDLRPTRSLTASRLVAMPQRRLERPLRKSRIRPITWTVCTDAAIR